MHPQLTLLLARARQQDLIAAAERARGVSSAAQPFWGPIIVRIATAGDRSSLERLAALQSTKRPTGATLIGELQERPVAALSLSDGTVIADPFVATGDVVALLRVRARQLNTHSRFRSLQRFARRSRHRR